MSDKPIVVRIDRGPSTDSGTFGRLTIDGSGFSCFTLELPWKNNQSNVSCIPEGTYECEYTMSPRFGRKFYRLNRVPNRAGILFHAGNWAGDKSKGLRTDVEGCILLGNGKGKLSGQDALTASRAALKAFETALDYKPFTLIVHS